MSSVPGRLPGDQLLKLVASSRTSIVLVAPYMKANAVERVLSEVSETVSEILFVTRWLPEDVASGATDLEVFSLVRAFPGARLLIHPSLHGKYFRGDATCLVGSANLTRRGLAWALPSNLELVVELPADHVGLREWETALIAASLQATEELRDQIEREAARVAKDGAAAWEDEAPEGTAEASGPGNWIPKCPDPEHLWNVYDHGDAAGMVASAVAAARSDIRALGIPEGLSREYFTASVVAMLRQMPLVTEIDALAQHGLSDAEAEAMLVNHQAVPDGGDSTTSWRIVKDWFMYFFPMEYMLQVGQQVLVRGREITRE